MSFHYVTFYTLYRIYSWASSDFGHAAMPPLLSPCRFRRFRDAAKRHAMLFDISMRGFGFPLRPTRRAVRSHLESAFLLALGSAPGVLAEA